MLRVRSCNTELEFGQKGGVHRWPKSLVESPTYPVTMSSAHSWNIEYIPLPWPLSILVSSDGHHTCLRVECESASLHVINRNFPQSLPGIPRETDPKVKNSTQFSWRNRCTPLPATKYGFRSGSRMVMVHFFVGSSVSKHLRYAVRAWRHLVIGASIRELRYIPTAKSSISH